MEPPNFYEDRNINRTSFSFQDGDHVADVTDLDPTLESSFNIQEFLATNSELFPDFLEEKSTPKASSNLSDSDIICEIKAALEADSAKIERSMPAFNSENNLGGSWAESVVTIKREDISPAVTPGPSAYSSPTHSASYYETPVTSPCSSVGIPVTVSPQTSPKSGSTRVNRKRSAAANRESEEYKAKRERNNIAVRKSRDKAKVRQVETERLVTTLRSDNQQLTKKVDLLQKELGVLKGLFLNVGLHLPSNYKKLISE
ncbi:unnamed protein product [Owenia fusiformis]|uniref:Uncharacterized protein n=1 Tax=Owenia fusiformis TaxID=6347 RepID=A0A8J1Y9M9_OWEFU|nr:unnamed protein product [Owenia fusiformis]